MDEYNFNEEKPTKKSNPFVTKILLSIIICLVSLIYINGGTNNKENFEKFFYSKSLPFNKFNKILNKYIDPNIIKTEKTPKTSMVFDEVYEEKKELYQNGTKIKYSSLKAIKNIMSGIVVFIGEKDNLGNTIIIQGVDGYDIWYSNISNSNIKIYDYVEKDSVLGDTEDLVITISKDGKFISYEEYNKKA